METPEELAEQLTRAYQPTGQDNLRHLLEMSDSYLSLILHRYPDGLPEDLRHEMDQLIEALRVTHKGM